MMEIIPLKIAIKSKFLVINVTKDFKDLYDENYKTLKRKCGR
jgi:hypothetical protein